MFASMFLPLAFVSSVNTRILERMVDDMPGCDQYISDVLVQDLADHDGAYSPYTRILKVTYGLDLDRLRYSIAHECGHAIDFATSLKRREHFGYGSFITDYASLSAEEDFAESYVNYVLNRESFIQAVRGDISLRNKYLEIQRIVTTFDK